MNRSGEQWGWIVGWSGGFIWVVILSILLFVQGRMEQGATGLGLAAVGMALIAVFAPWRHPRTAYWLLMLPIYGAFFACIAWAVWTAGADGLGLNRFSWFLVLPALLPLAIAGQRRWDDDAGGEL